MVKRNSTTTITKSSISSSNSLIEILQSFGIVIKTKLNFHDPRKSENLEQQFATQLASRNDILVIDDPNRGDSSELSHHFENGNAFYRVATSPNKFNSCVDFRKAKIIIRFKCDFDHEKAFDRKEDIFSDNTEQSVKRAAFYSIVRSERKNTNAMHIEFDMKFNSIVEIVKYLKISECKGNLSIENEILSRMVEILDIDQEKKQVYIKLKTFDTSSTANLSSFYLMGKIDGSNSCFMLDLSYYVISHRKLLTIDSIYRFFTPHSIKNRIYGKGKPTTFHDCKEIGIYRVLIGCFFIGMTDSDAGMYIKRDNIHPYDVTRDFLDPQLICKGKPIIISERSSKKYFFDFRHEFFTYGGIIDTGYYKFELQSLCKFDSHWALDFKREVYHFLL